MLTLILFISGFALARAERPAPPRTGTLEFGAAYAYYTSSTNYDLNSNKVADPNGGGLSTNAGLLSGSYDFNGRFRAYGGLTYADTSTTDGFFDRDNGTVTEVPVGAQYFGTFNRFLWVAQADAGLALYHVDEGSDSAAVAEGANRVRGGGWLIYRAGNIQPFAYLAGEYRDAGRSALLPYAVGAHLRVDTFWVQGAVQGYVAFGNDADSATINRARREFYLTRVNGGSFRYYAVNPSMHELELQLGWRVNQFNIYATGNYQVYGQSTAQGWGLTAGVRFALSTRAPKYVESANRGPDEPGFTPKEEAYDESLFKEPVRVRNPAPPPGVEVPVAPAQPKVRLVPKKKKKKLNRKIEKQQENLNKLLNDTEKDLEHQ